MPYSNLNALDLPMMAMSIVLKYLPGTTLEKTEREFIFTRGIHNVSFPNAYLIEAYPNPTKQSRLKIAHDVVCDISNLEING